MIFTISISLMFSFLSFIFGLLPKGAVLPAPFVSTIVTMVQTMNGWSWFLPIDALYQCLTIVFAWFSFKFLWDFVHWILRKIPVVNVR